MEERPMDMQDVPRMSPEELYTRMAQGEAVVVLDVRTMDGLSVHPDQIPGTRRPPRAEGAQQAHPPPPQKTIVTYWTWHSEASSARAAQWLQMEGFEAVYA